MSGCSVPSTSVSTRDFKSDKDRVNFINTVMPVAVPRAAQRIVLEFEEWQGMSLDAKFELPPHEFDEFVKTIREYALERGTEFDQSDDAIFCTLAPKSGLEAELGRGVATQIWINRKTRSTRIQVLAGDPIESDVSPPKTPSPRIAPSGGEAQGRRPIENEK
jgi:hypothetical protein